MRKKVHCFQHFFHGEEMSGLFVLDFEDLAKPSLTYHMHVLVVAFTFLFDDRGLHLFFDPARNRNLFAEVQHLEGVSAWRQSYLWDEEQPLRLLLALVLSVIFWNRVVYELSSWAEGTILSGSGLFLNVRMLSCVFLRVYFFYALLASFLDLLELWVCM